MNKKADMKNLQKYINYLLWIILFIILGLAVKYLVDRLTA